MMNKKKTVKGIYNVLLKTGFEGSYILQCYQENEVIHANLKLPPQKDKAALIEILPNLQQELRSLDVRIGKENGKYIELLFGNDSLEEVPFIPQYLNDNSLKITLKSSFGCEYLDFEDGASCHLLNGGAPRMGKTIFLLYVSTCLYAQNKGNIEIFINSPKVKDFYPFQNIPKVHLANDETSVNLALDRMIRIYKRRNQLLYSKKLEKATDAKSVRELYPSYAHLFKPMFLIIDEYGRFAENMDIQDKVMELVETAGFVNVHVLIATQRPDARTVLRPRIKQGLQARICFRVPDQNNSIVVLDCEGAEQLPKTKGRAILLDGDKTIIQVPYMSYEQCEELLKDYKEEKKDVNQGKKGCNDKGNIEKFQGLFKESISLSGLQGKQQPGECDQQSDEKTRNGWYLLANQKD
jgi:DNA segregation ATPase FtsK/SpoIIIE-like protein